MRKRRAKVLFVVFGIGILYYILIRTTGFAIPCIFRKMTGWKCPGCGITTLILSLVGFDLEGAFHANPFLFITGPALLAEIGYTMWLQDKGRKIPGWNNTLIILYGIALCVFGVRRNLKHI